MIKRLIHDILHIIPTIIPRLRLGLIWGSRDDTQADMEKDMYNLYVDIWCGQHNHHIIWHNSHNLFGNT